MSKDPDDWIPPNAYRNDPPCQRPTDGEPPIVTHQYDNPALSAIDFLCAVMRDRHTPFAVRMDAAFRLMSINPDYVPPALRQVSLTYRINSEGLALQ